jgi:trk system potassium uptake protein TrkH
MREGWRRRLGDRVVRRPRQREVAPVRLKVHHRRRIPIPPNTAVLLFLTFGFAALIVIGTILLLLPFASVPDGAAPFRVALFTSTSAACVTGLVVVTSATYWTGFGQSVIAAQMFLGGLGIMTTGTMLLLAVGRRLTLADRLTLREPMGATTLGYVSRLGWQIFLFAAIVQAAGFALLFPRFLFLFSPGQAAWQALFHSISAFNNAGFAILPDSASLDAFQHDTIVLSVIGILIVLGGLSFAVVAELSRRRRFNRWNLDTQLVVLGSLLLWVLGGVAFFAFETANTATLKELPLSGQIGNSFFQVVSGRTAGFSSVDFGATRSVTNFLYMALMFIGGASASTAGGIKVGTFMVLLVAAWAALRGRNHAEVFRRELPYTYIARAIAVVLLASVMVLLLILSLAVSESAKIEAGAFNFQSVLFEMVSAFGTNGLSTGITSQLTAPGQYLLALGMYLGRVGPLTLAMGLALRERRAIYRYAQERVRIG